MPKFNEWLFGKKPKVKQAKSLTPEQEQLMSLITEGLTKGEGAFKDIFGGFDKKAFDEGVSQPALKNFQDNILPQLQEKFIAGNQVLGSGMRQGQLKAATDLQSQLAQLIYQAQQDAQKNKFAGLQTALGTKQFENLYQPGNEGVLSKTLQAAGSSLGALATGGRAGGPAALNQGGLPQAQFASNAAKTATTVG